MDPKASSHFEKELPPIRRGLNQRLIQCGGAEEIFFEFTGMKEFSMDALALYSPFWIPNEWLVHPTALLARWGDEGRTPGVAVATAFQKSYLEGQGWKNVRAIGLPFLYLPKLERKAENGSLLVVVPDFLVNDAGFENEIAHWIEWKTKHPVLTLFGKFENFPREVRERIQGCGIQMVEDGGWGDRNYWKRAQVLISSHDILALPYLSTLAVAGAYWGARIAVNPISSNERGEEWKQDSLLQRPYAVTRKIWEMSAFSKVREKNPTLFCFPDQAQTQHQWGREESGSADHKNPWQILDVMGWSSIQQKSRRQKEKRERLWWRIPQRIRIRIENWRNPELRESRKEIRRLELLPRYQPGWTTVRGTPVHYVDALTFLPMRKSIFEDEIYRYVSLEEKPKIIDGGANIGLAILYWKRLYPHAEIEAFEPDPSVFQVLQENIKAWRFEGITLHQRALWKQNETLTFSSEGSDAGSLAQGAPASKAIHVEAIRLQEKLHQPVDFLKLDIEGAEVPVLEDCEEELKNVAHLFVEYHGYWNRPQELQKLLSVLEKSGFRTHIQSDLSARHPFVARDCRGSMDVTLNIFAYRE